MASLIEMQRAARAKAAFGSLMSDYSESNGEKESESPIQELICELLEAEQQARVFHWNTSSFAEHKAMGDFYEAIGDLVDTFVEAYMGEHGRVNAGHELEIMPYTMDAPLTFVQSLLGYIKSDARMCCMGNSALNNILDEIQALCEKTIYLLSLK